MKKFRKKQKKLKAITNSITVFTAVYIFIYYGIEPTITKIFSSAVMSFLMGIMYVLLFISLILLYFYTVRYSKSDKFLESVEYELSDNGYYITSRQEKTASEYKDVMINDLKNNGFKIESNVTVDEFDVDFIASKRKDIFYIVREENLEKTDIIAYIDAVTYDFTSVKLKRKGNVVITFICDNADEGAVSLSKMITPIGKKSQITIALAIVELGTKNVYFLGNKPSKCRNLIANYVMNCDLPIKKDYIGAERLPFQNELEKHMESFNIKDFNKGTFYAHE